MASMTADEVGRMEHELIQTKAQLIQMTSSLAVVESSNSQLRSECRRLRVERDEARDTATEVKTILTQTSAGLLAGIQRFQARRMADQERKLGVGEGKAAFEAQSEEPEPEPSPPAPERAPEGRRMAEGAPEAQSLIDRVEEVLTAPEAPSFLRRFGAGPRPTYRAGEIDQTLADRDPRLPQVSPVSADLDADALQSLAGFRGGRGS